MQCPQCGFMMTASAAECPRCALHARQALTNPAPAQPSRRAEPSAQTCRQQMISDAPVAGVGMIVLLVFVGLVNLGSVALGFFTLTKCTALLSKYHADAAHRTMVVPDHHITFDATPQFIGFIIFLVVIFPAVLKITGIIAFLLKTRWGYYLFLVATAITAAMALLLLCSAHYVLMIVFVLALCDVWPGLAVYFAGRENWHALQ